MIFKPMLASAIEDTSKLRFPVMASIKLDGIRATVQGGRLLSRSLKDIPNKNVQMKFTGLPNGLDGELIYGDPAHPDCYRNTTSIVMSEDKSAKNIRFLLFDIFEPGGFEQRFSLLSETAAKFGGFEDLEVVPHTTIANEEELLAVEAFALEKGHEGIMVRSFTGPYKQGRSTEKEGYLLKLKRFKDSEAEILAVIEQMHNGNVAKKNELGHTERSTAKAGMVGKGMLGALSVRDIKTGVEFEIGTGFVQSARIDLWGMKDDLIGKTIKYKYFPTGSKERPRFPVFIGFRDPRDMESA
jgi:DNA ligase-1